MRAVSSSSTKAELKAALDKAGIDYSSTDTKADLLEKAGIES